MSEHQIKFYQTGTSTGPFCKVINGFLLICPMVIQLAHRHRSHSKTVSYLHITDTKRRE